jgi:hypothetical protein
MAHAAGTRPMANSFHRCNAAAFVIALWLPGLQLCTGMLPCWPLGGVEALPPEPAPRSFAAWDSGRLQAEAEWHATHDLGLRDWMIRIDNQLAWSLFGVLKKPVIRGSDGWLYFEDWLPDRDLLLPEFHPRALLRVANLQLLQRVLDEHGVRLCTVIAPGKARLYPEHLPAGQRAVASSGVPDAYGVFRAAATGAGLRLCDFQEVFAGWKTADPDEPLFTRLGIHWSVHAGARAAAWLLDAIGRSTDLAVPGLEVTGTTRQRGAPGRDADLLRMANLLDERSWRDDTWTITLAPRAGHTGRPLRLLVVGTSFSWNLVEPLSRYGAAEPLTFLYYYKTRYEYAAGEAQPKQPVDAFRAALREQLLRYDVVLLENHSLSLLVMGFDFVEEALRAFGETPLTAAPPEAAGWIQAGRK